LALIFDAADLRYFLALLEQFLKRVVCLVLLLHFNVVKWTDVEVVNLSHSWRRVAFRVDRLLFLTLEESVCFVTVFIGLFLPELAVVVHARFHLF
jgi:hypothetical protein